MHNLGDLLDKGAVHQNQEQVVSQVTGHTLKTISPDGKAWLNFAFAADKTFTGTVRAFAQYSLTDFTSKANGTWTVDPDGKWCLNITMTDWNMKQRSCFHLFFMPDQMVLSGSANDRAAQAGLRPRSDLQ
jgi:hypothetical protein